MNKKGQGLQIAMIVLLFIVVIGGGLFAWQSGALGGQAQQVAQVATAQQLAQATKQGEVASLKAFGFNETKDAPNTKIAGTAYFWKDGNPTLLLGGSTTLSSSATVSVPSVNVGDTIHGVAFDSSHYGTEVIEVINEEAEQMELPLHYIATSMTYRIEEDGATEGAPSIDVSGNEEDSFNKFVVSQTDTDAEFRLKAICFKSGVSASVTNISTIKIVGLTQMSIPPGKKSQQYCWEFAETQILGEFEEFEFGPVTIKGDSDGCSTNEETVTVTYIDEARFVAKDGSIKLGIEQDDDSNSDPGATDSSFTDSFTCS